MIPKLELEIGKAGKYPRPVFHRKFLLFSRLVTSIPAESPGRGADKLPPGDPASVSW